MSPICWVCYIPYVTYRSLQRLKSAIMAHKVPMKRWLESDSVIKEAQNNQRYHLGEDNGRFVQLEQDQLNLSVLMASYSRNAYFQMKQSHPSHILKELLVGVMTLSIMNKVFDKEFYY